MPVMMVRPKVWSPDEMLSSFVISEVVRISSIEEDEEKLSQSSLNCRDADTKLPKTITYQSTLSMTKDNHVGA